MNNVWFWRQEGLRTVTQGSISVVIISLYRATSISHQNALICHGQSDESRSLVEHVARDADGRANTWCILLTRRTPSMYTTKQKVWSRVLWNTGIAERELVMIQRHTNIVS